MMQLDEEPQCGRDAAVPPRGTQDTAPHLASLLCVQSPVGLDHLVSDVLHGHHGALQRGL